MINKYINGYKRMPIPAKAAFWFALSIMLQKGISFLTLPIFTRIMTVEQYGVFSVYLSWVSIITILGGLEFHTCVYINGLTKFESISEKDDLAVSLINLSVLITTGLLLIYLINRPFWDNVFGLPSSIVIIMIFEVYFVPAINLWSTKQRFQYKYKLLVFVTLLQVITSTAIGFFMVLVADKFDQALMRVSSIAFVTIAFGGIFIFFFMWRSRKIFIAKYWKYALKLHIPLLPHSLSLTVLSSADRVMINNLVGSSDAAIYSVAYSASMVINLIKLSITQAMTPWIYDCIKRKQFDSLKKIFNLVLVMVAAFTFIFILFAPEIIKIVATPEYYKAIIVVPPVAASVFFTFLYNMFASIEFYYEETKMIMYASVFAALLNIGLNIILIPKFGFVVAGYTTLFCYILLSVAHYFVMRLAVRKNIGNIQLFNLKFIIIISIVVLVCVIAVSFIYSFIWIRYFLIAAIITYVITKRNDMKIILDTIRDA